MPDNVQIFESPHGRVAVHNAEVFRLMRPSYTPAQIAFIRELLHERGVFDFNTYSSGLFPAAATGAHNAYTNYHNAWVRDSVHVALALHEVGRRAEAAGAMKALLRHFEGQFPRFDAIIRDPFLKNDAMRRPHIRFDGESLGPLAEKWPHAQNDALGIMVFALARMLGDGTLEVSPAAARLLRLFVLYMESIHYVSDADNGHWEETAKVEASSIGAVVAGLEGVQRLEGRMGVDRALAARAAEQARQGRAALESILPWESREGVATDRRFDAALLFLVAPLGVVDNHMALRIAQDVRGNLEEPFGVRRYNGDSYWCADYDLLVAESMRSSDYSGGVEARDKLCKQGGEAQWCLFDSMLSRLYAQLRYTDGIECMLPLQFHYLNRALGQLTGEGSPHGAFKMPESYYCRRGEWVPNDSTPLNWAKASLMVALSRA
jgi:phosphorylase kinase alpha/beta subunit